MGWWDPGGPPSTGDPAPGERSRRREGCASGCNAEPAVSAASAGWAEVAPAKRGQTTGSGLDPPLSRRAHRDRIPGLEEPGPEDGGRDNDAEAHRGAGTAEEAPTQNFHRPGGYLTGQPTNQPPTLTLGVSRRLPGPGPVPRRRLGAGGVEAMNVAGATVP